MPFKKRGSLEINELQSKIYKQCKIKNTVQIVKKGKKKKRSEFLFFYILLNKNINNVKFRIIPTKEK